MFFMVFQGSRLVFHGSRWLLRVIHGSRSVFIAPGRFFMVPGGFLRFFMVPGFFIVSVQLLWVFKVSGWFFMVLGRFV